MKGRAVVEALLGTALRATIPSQAPVQRTGRLGAEE
jgi:hypothetical protein